MTRVAIPTRKALKYESSGTTEYIGEARLGAAESDPIWRIQRITYSGQNFVIEWADGNDEFDNIWADRASLSYS